MGSADFGSDFGPDFARANTAVGAASRAPFTCPALADSINATAALLPRGRAWPANDQGLMAQFLEWLAGRINLLVAPNGFDRLPAWGAASTGTATPNATTGPFGLNDGFAIASAVGDNKVIGQVVAGGFTGRPQTAAIFAKQDTALQCEFALLDQVTSAVVGMLAVAWAAGIPTAFLSIDGGFFEPLPPEQTEEIGGGWYRFFFTYTGVAGHGEVFQIYPEFVNPAICTGASTFFYGASITDTASVFDYAPPAPAQWPAGFVQAGFIAALGTVRNWIESRFCALKKEFFCASASQTLDLWMAEYGLPDACDPFPSLCAKVAATGGAQCSYFAAIAETAGWAITCVNDAGFCGSMAGAALAGAATAGGSFALGITITVMLTESPAYSGGQQTQPLAGLLLAGMTLNCAPNINSLQCLLERVLPAHIPVTWVTE